MKNLLFLAIWALVLSFLLGLFYWSDAALPQRLMFGALTALVTGTWLILLVNMPRIIGAVRAWLKPPVEPRSQLGPKAH